MQAERAHHEIERVRADRQPLLVGDKARRARSAFDHGGREIGLDQQIGRGLLAQHRPELSAMAAEVKDAGEAALHVVEPAHQPLAHLADQEVAPPCEAGGSAVAVGAHGGTVEDRGAVSPGRALGHAAGYGMMDGRREAQEGAGTMLGGVHGGVLAALARTAATVAIDQVLPPSCLACDAPVSAVGGLCPDCWSRITFIGRPCCARCGLPFAIEAAPDAICGDCARVPPVSRPGACGVPLRRGRAPADPRLQDGRPLVARAQAGLVAAARCGSPLLPEADVVVPVPLHRWRLLARRFNQAAVLARLMAHQSDAIMVPDALIRTRRTATQTRLSRPERRRNVRGAFAVRRSRMSLVAGRSVLLVDDVMTTGATVSACARALRKARAARVDVVTLARALPSRP